MKAEGHRMLKKIAEAINKAGTIAILPHIAADGDAVGSSLALAIALSRCGKNASVLLEEKIPQLYDFLPGIELSLPYTGEEGVYELAIALDCGDIYRLGSRRGVFEKAQVTVNIDHHPTNTGFAVYDYVDTKAAATGEILYRLMEHMGIRPDMDVSSCLYTAIVTDTGGFRYSNTTPETFSICSKLLEAGVDLSAISHRVFEVTSLSKVRLTGEAISTLEVHENGKVAVMMLTAEAMKRSGASDEDSDGIINIARNINGVEAAAILKELDNGDIKVSLRSNDYLDVSQIARKHSGGGHVKAAGFTVKDGSGMKKAATELLHEIKELL